MDVASRAYRTGEEAVWTWRTGRIMLEQGPSGLGGAERVVRERCTERIVMEGPSGLGEQSVSCWRIGRLDLAEQSVSCGRGAQSVS